MRHHFSTWFKPLLTAFFVLLLSNGFVLAQTLVVDEDITLDFNQATPAYVGPEALAPFFGWEKPSADAATWFAKFDLGPGNLVVEEGVVVRILATSGGHVPGLRVRAANLEWQGALEMMGTGSIGALHLCAQANWTLAPSAALTLLGATAPEVRFLAEAGTLTLRGLVRVEGGAADVAVNAAGSMVIDGSRFLEHDAQAGMDRHTGIYIADSSGGWPGKIRVEAGGSLEIVGYRPANQGEANLIIEDAIAGSGGPPVNLRLADRPGGNGVEVTLTVPTGQGDLLGFFGNVSDESIVPNLSYTYLEGGAITQAAFAVNNVSQVGGGNNVNPAKNWDFGLKFGQQGSSTGQINRAKFLLLGPGLTAQKLLNAQNDSGWVFGLRLQANPGSKKLGVRAPVSLPATLSSAALTAAHYGENGQGGEISVFAGGALKLLNQAVDVRHGAGSNAKATLQAVGPVEIASVGPNQVWYQFGIPVVHARSHGAGQGARVLIQSHQDKVTVGPGAAIRADFGLVTQLGHSGQAHPNDGEILLSACTEFENSGFILPAPSQALDNIGVCEVVPQVSILEPSASGLLQGPLSMQGTASPAGTEIRVNGVLVPLVNGVWQAAPALSEGSHLLQIEALRNGMRRTLYRCITLDSTQPEITGGFPEALVRGNVYQLAFQASDANGIRQMALLIKNSLAISVQGNSLTYSFAVAENEPANALTLTVVATDNAGLSRTLTQNVPVISPPINLEVTQPQSGLTAQTQVQVQGQVTPPGAQVLVNGAPVTRNGLAFSSELALAEGPNAVQITATFFGSTPVEIVRQVTVDSKAPILSITAPEVAIRGEDLAFQVSLSDAHPPETFEIYANDLLVTHTATSPFNGQWPISLDEPMATLVLKAVATDLAGNQAEVTRAVSLQDPSLEVTITSPAADAFLADGTVVVRGTVTPEAAEVTVNGQPTTRTGAQWQAALTLPDGAASLTATAAYGNLSPVNAVRSITVDTQSPQVTLTAPSEAFRGDTVSYDVTVSDANPAASFAIYVNDVLTEAAATSPFSGTVTIAPDEPLAAMTLRIEASDLAGNTTSETASIALQDANLAVTITEPAADAFLADGTVVVRGTVDPEAAEVTVNGQPTTRNGAQWEVALTLPDGAATLTATATYGNLSPISAVRTITVDTESPQVTLTAPSEAFRGDMVSYEVSVNDANPAASFAIYVNDALAEAAATSPFSGSLSIAPAEPLTAMTLRIEASDLAGNTTSESASIALQDANLAVSIADPAADAFLANGTVVVRGTVDPEAAEVTVNGQPSIRNGAQWEAALTLPDGVATLTATATYGNLSPVSAVRSITVDTLPPQVTLTAPSEAFRGDTVAYEVSVSDANPAASFAIYVNDVLVEPTATSPFSGSLSIAPDEPLAAMTLRIEASDLAGNTISESASIALQDANLAVSITDPAADAFVNNGTVVVRGTVDPEAAEVTVNGQPTTRNGAQWEVALTLPDGAATLTATATYGNLSPVNAVRTITVDTQPPSVVLELSGPLVRGEQVTVSATASDANAIVSLQLTLAGQQQPLVQTATSQALVFLVPADAPESLTFSATAVDEAGLQSTETLTAPVINVEDLERVIIAIDAPLADAVLPTAEQTLSGSVNPADAALVLNGQPVVLSPEGTFSVTVALTSGINTYLLRATHPNYLPGSQSLDLYLDGTQPVIEIISPQNGTYLNQAEVELLGRVTDQYDPSPTLTLNGAPVAVEANGFRIPTFTLTPGENSLAFEATDAAGNTTNYTHRIFFQSEGPQVLIEAPAQIQPGSQFQITVSTQPQDQVVELQVFVNQQQIHRAENGEPFSTTLTHSGRSPFLSLQAHAHDRYGNLTTETVQVGVAFPHFLHGQVLDDATSWPLANVALEVSSPFWVQNLVTDAEGRFESYIYGYPVTVRHRDASFVPLVRHMPAVVDAWRVPDMRLTTRSGDASGQLVTVSGFAGVAQITGFGSQGLPRLLPLGWSPLAGFELAQVTGSGSLNWRVPGLFLPEGVPVQFFFLNAQGWRLLGQSGPSSFALDLAQAEPGIYLAAVADAWANPSIPDPGAYLTRTREASVPAGTVASSQTNPSKASILADPSTQLSATVVSQNEVLSGSIARIETQEIHERFNETLRLAPYGFDLVVYSYGFGNQGLADRLGGTLRVKARQQVVPDLTRTAELQFTLFPGITETRSFLEESRIAFPGLALDFSPSFSNARVASIRSLTFPDFPSLATATWLNGFELNVGGSLDVAPAMTLEAGSFAEVILLREWPSFGWAYAGRLRQEANAWVADAGALDIRPSGRYALVGLPSAMTEVRGTALADGAPLADVRISTSAHPWLGASAADGGYRFLVPQTSTRINAFAKAQGREGTLTVAPGPGQSVLTDQILNLAPLDFSLVSHEPAANQAFLELLPQILLTFSQPVTSDTANLQANLQLSTISGQAVPLQILAETGRMRLRILPTQALLPGTQYQFTVLPGLEDIYGLSFGEAASFAFSTRLLEAARELDLNRFRMSWENGEMFVEAPETAFPQGTALEIRNEATAYAFTGTLSNAPFRQRVDARPGDILELQATTPTGEIVLGYLSRVVTGPDRFVLGHQPFSLELENGIGFHVSDIRQGGRQEVSLAPVAVAETQADLAEVAVLEGAPPLTVLQSWDLKTTDTQPMPGFAGQLDVPASLLGNGQVHLVALVSGVQGPADPDQPDMLSSHTFAYLLDVANVAGGQVSQKRQQQTRKTNPDVAGLVFEFGEGTALYRDSLRLALIQVPESANKASGFLTSVFGFRITRKNSPNIVPEKVVPQLWHQGLVDRHPVPGAPVYWVITRNQNLQLVLGGVSDETGYASVYTFSDPTIWRALDPQTGEVARAGFQSNNLVEDLYSLVLYQGFRLSVLFDADNHLVLSGQAPPPTLTVRWEAGRTENGVFVANPEISATLARTNSVRYTADLMLRVVVQTNQPLGETPPPRLYLNSGEALTPEIDGQTLTFTFSPAMLSADLLLDTRIEVANQGGQTREITRQILVRGGDTPASKPGPPILVAALPENLAKNLPIDTGLYLAFSEPVRGINRASLTLQAGSGDFVELDVFSQDGDAVNQDSWVTEVYANPRKALQLGTTYTAVVSGLRDSENLALALKSWTFETLPLMPENSPGDQTAESVFGYRNLVLVANHNYAGRDLGLRLMDLRYSDQPLRQLWSKVLQLPGALQYQMAFFTPEALASDDPAAFAQTEAASARVAVNDLPVGGVLALAYLRYGGLGMEMKLFRYLGEGNFEFELTFPLTALGLPTTHTQMGAHWMLGFFQPEALGPASRGQTYSFHLPTVLREFKPLQSRWEDGVISRLEYESQLFRLGQKARFPVPGDVRSLTSMVYKRGNAFKSGFLVGGTFVPGIFDFDPSNQPTALGAPFPAPDAPNTLTDQFDGRMLVYTNYADNFVALKAYSGFVNQLGYLPQGSASLVQADFALFAYQRATSGSTSGSGAVEIFQLSDAETAQPAVLQPKVRLEFPAGIRTMAVDSRSGLIAIAQRDNLYSVMDLRTLLEGIPQLPDTQVLSQGFSHPAFIFEAPLETPLRWLAFHAGNLLGGDTARNLVRIPLTPQPFLELGWSYYDLNAWTSASQQSTLAFAKPKRTPNMVFYAADRVLDGAAPEFTMELGSFEIEIQRRSDVKVRLLAVNAETGETAPIHEFSRTGVQGPGFATFAMLPLRSYFDGNSGRQSELRRQGYLKFRLQYRVFEAGRLKVSGENDFLLVYRHPSTRYQDAYRTLGPLDGLALMPDLYQVDHALSTGDARLNLSPARYLNPDVAFQAGVFGMGMADAQVLHLGMPLWWDLGRMGSGLPTWTASELRMIFEHPGQFHYEFQRQDATKAALLNSLQGQLTFAEGRWTLIHRDDMAYELATQKNLPHAAAMLQTLNAGISAAESDRVRLPVFRAVSGRNAPAQWLVEASLLKQKNLVWDNSLTRQNTSEGIQVQENIADNGGSRTSILELDQNASGNLVSKLTTPDNMAVSYRYDDHGYLIQVLWQNQRPQTYAWETITSLNGFPLKRLKSVTQANESLIFGTDKPHHLHVAKVSTPFGEQPLAITLSDTGLPQTVTLQGLQSSGTVNRDTPASARTFQPLESGAVSKELAVGSAVYSIGWDHKKVGARSEYLLKSHGYLNQTFQYDNEGRLLSHQRNGGEESWAYENTLPGFANSPTSYINAAGESFTLEESRTGQTVSHGNAQTTMRYSGSGVPMAVTDPLGMRRGTENTKDYLPSGNGYVPTNGRLEHIPIPGQRDIKAAKLAYNEFWDVKSQTDMGVTTSYADHDDLGRPRVVETLDGVIFDLTYGYENGLYKVTQTERISGVEQVQFFSSRGNLVRREQANAEGRVVLNYSYDDLNRLLTISQDTSETPITRYEATYASGNETQLPNKEKVDAETLEFTLAAGYNPRITQVVRTLDGMPLPITFETDELGRVVKTEIENEGKVALTYDGFGRVLTRRSLTTTGKNNLNVTYTYGNKSIEIDDQVNDLRTRIQYADDAGWQRTVETSGAGIDTSTERVYQTQVIPSEDGLGYLITESESGGLLLKNATVSATGEILGQAYGPYAWEVPLAERDRFGNAKKTTGMYESETVYDAEGRPRSVTDPHGLLHRFDYDALFRLNSVTDPRGKTYSLSYFGVTGDTAAVNVEGQNINGTPTVPTLSATSRTQATTQTWQGRERNAEIKELGRRQEVTRTLENGSTASAAVVQDSTTGLVEMIRDFSGDETTFEWSEAGRNLKLTQANGEIFEMAFDGFGQLRQLKEDGVQKLRLIRDSENRVKQVLTETRNLEMDYLGANLRTITGGRHTLYFDQHNGQGLAQSIRIGDVAKVETAYHSGGLPARVMMQRTGGEATVVETLPTGEIQMIQRGHQPAVYYTSNEWGAPATMKLAGEEPMELFSGDLQTLNLPASTTVRMDTQARVQSVQRPGLGLKTYSYDASDRVEATQVGGQPQESYTYEDGELVERVAGQGALQDTQRFVRDGKGRVLEVQSSLDGVSRMDYVLPEGVQPQPNQRHSDRVQRYTDPNGVVYRYTYNDDGYLTHINIEDGPTFVYNYDPAGNLLEVAVDGMATRYANYVEGLPSDSEWIYNDESVQTFTLTRTEKGRLQKLESGAFRLELEWTPEPDPADFPQPVIRKLTKKGPGLKEIWEPAYSEDQRLTGLIITRTSGSDVDADPLCGDCQVQVIEETYGSKNELMLGLRRLVDGVPVLDTLHTLDATADERRIDARQTTDGPLPIAYDDLGSITDLSFSAAVTQTFALDGMRKVRQISTTTADGTRIETYGYDSQNRRITRGGGPTLGKLVYAHQGSRVIAIGQLELGGTVRWSHAFGHGPMGPSFVKDLTFQGQDAFLFTDHLGTPFGYYHPATGTTEYTPYNPWGELLAPHPDRGPPWTRDPAITQPGQVPNPGFPLAQDPLFAIPPMGLAGHLYDTETGLVQMHNRYYSPRLGHFLTPDYRAPNIYDPSTFTEPYAYAAGNPMLYMDPDGLERDSAPFDKTREDFDSDAAYIQALLAFLSNDETWRPWKRPFDSATYNVATRTYRNFDPSLGIFTSIETTNELAYQLEILGFILDNNLASGQELDIYQNLYVQLTGVKDEFTEALSSGNRYDQQIIRWNKIEQPFWGSPFTKPPSEWNAVIDNYQGHDQFVNDVVLIYEVLGLAYAGGSKLVQTRPFTSAVQGLKRFTPRISVEARTMQMAGGDQISVPHVSFSVGGRQVGSFRGPAARGFNWEHIFDRHAPWGKTARQRTRSGATVFEGLTSSQIKARVKAAWKNRELMQRQVAPDGSVQLRYHGVDPISGQTLEFWFIESSRIVESVYPILP